MFAQDNKIRKYTCFVCGKVFDTYDEMQLHIKENYTEGREYLLCPLKYCGKCVRDIRAHFKCVHKSVAIPKNIQLRPTVMFDVTSSSKRKKVPTFKEGYHISKKNNNKAMKYRSGYEKDVYESLEIIGEVLKYDVESFGIEYYFRSKRHTYYPDIMVQFIDGNIEIWEVKPANQKSMPVNKAKWAAAEHYCKLRGWNFEVIDENAIHQLKKKASM